MSFDTEPDGDPHGQCAEEIHRLETENDSLRKAYEAERKKADEMLVENNASFDLRHGADKRAIKRWHEAYPDKVAIWPDHADLCVWLIEELEKVRKERDGYKACSNFQASYGDEEDYC